MNTLSGLVVWEVRHLFRSGLLPVVCGGLLAAGLLAAWVGGRVLDRHEAEVAGLQAQYEEQMTAVARQFTPEGEAGYVAYYTFFPTHHPMEPLAGLATGVRDVVPSVVWVRMLGLEGQIYESDLGNPIVQSLGSFDLAFVFCALVPLGLFLLLHDTLSRERDSGRLALIATCAGSLRTFLIARVAVRTLAAGLAVTLAFLGACLWIGVPFDRGAVAWLAAGWAGVFCWSGIGAFIAVVARSSAAGLATALAVWISAVVLVPALLNLAVATVFPVVDGLELTVAQRQDIHGAWDRPRAEIMDKFFVKRPEWRDTPPVVGRFAWRWYYAMQEMGDEAVAPLSEAHRRNLRARHAAMARLAWLAPPAYAQLLFSARSGTDLDAHLGWLDRVRAFHEELRQYFLPLCFADASITPAEYADFPLYSPAGTTGQRGPSVFPLIFIGLAGWAGAVLSLRRSTLH